MLSIKEVCEIMSNEFHQNELYHYGVKGMKWGVRRYVQGGGISGAIRRKQRSNAQNDLNNIKSRQKQIDSELRELKGYAKNPSKIGSSKISTAIRNSQIKSLKKTKMNLKAKEQANLDALKELDSIEKYAAKKSADKALKKMNKIKIKDLEKQYGDLENNMSYGKKADTKANSRIEGQMSSIEQEINNLKKKR